MLNRAIALLVLMIAGALACYGQESEKNGSQSPSLRVEATTVTNMFNQTPKSFFAVGSDIYALVVITNNSSEELSISSGHPWRQFNIELTKDGEVMPFKKSVREFLTPSPDQPYHGSIAVFTLKPNANSNELLHLNEWYEFLPAGHYRLTVGRIWGREFTAKPIEFDIYQ
jgi:hypothetical protein